MNELIKRLKSPTPKFFKKVINIGLTLGTIGGAIMLAPTTIPGLVLPALLIKSAEIMAIVGAVSAAVAKTTVDDNKEIKQDK